MKTWKYTFNNETIEVENSLSSCRLLINGTQADKKEGLMYEAELLGTLSSGEKVKARLGGMLEISCALYINDVKQNPIEN